MKNLTNGDEERETNQKGVSRERREYRIALKGYGCIQNWLNKTQITKERVWRGKRFGSKGFRVNDPIQGFRVCGGLSVRVQTMSAAGLGFAEPSSFVEKGAPSRWREESQV